MPHTTIHLLPDYLANQIAAGEVVQRPESVVKELVENSVDAGATHITVIVRDAGKTLIHTLDNGIGLSKEDLELATLRHATSKITSQDDLHAIRTLGFRGEALASIAAVADVEIRTRREADSTGWMLRSTPGTFPDLKPCTCDQGTQVYVRNLFYNVPARKKFLKSDSPSSVTSARPCSAWHCRVRTFVSRSTMAAFWSSIFSPQLFSAARLRCLRSIHPECYSR